MGHQLNIEGAETFYLFVFKLINVTSKKQTLEMVTEQVHLLWVLQDQLSVRNREDWIVSHCKPRYDLSMSALRLYGLLFCSFYTRT